jgi:hypothetical protein
MNTPVKSLNPMADPTFEVQMSAILAVAAPMAADAINLLGDMRSANPVEAISNAPATKPSWTAIASHADDESEICHSP